MSNTPKTDALFFPYGRDHTAAASPSFLTCMTEYELLEKENAALRERADKAERERAVAITQFAEWTKVLEQSKQKAVAEALRDAADACKKELLIKHDDDVIIKAYNDAVNDCIRAILALIPVDSIAKVEGK